MARRSSRLMLRALSSSTGGVVEPSAVQEEEERGTDVAYIAAGVGAEGAEAAMEQGEEEEDGGEWGHGVCF